MPKVLISDSLSLRAVDIFKNRGLEVDVKTGMTPEELIECIGNYDGLAVRSATKVTPEVLAAAKNLKVVGRAGIGVDNINIDEASANGVVVMNTPFGNAITTAEHAIAMMFALARQIPSADQMTQAGKWEKSRFMGTELTGKTLGIIGCGNIGSRVAERAIGLKMRVVAYDPFLTVDRAQDLGVEKVELEELFPRADIITLHTPLTDATRDVLNKTAFAQMRDGVLIVNCARGELVVEEDIKSALESGKVGGFAVDVFPTEPPENYSLFGMDNVVATPHLGAATAEAQENVALQVAEQMSDYLLSGAVVNAINMASVSAEDAPKLKPYMHLAELLGGFAGQIIETGLQSITIEYEGHAASLNTKPLTACALTGVMSPAMESVNMVNAPVIARDRNIGVSIVNHERECEYQTLVHLTVKTEKRQLSVAGTLIGGDKPRIVEIGGVPMEASLGRQMVYTVNRDMPGIIGAFGMAMANAGVNIANFILGRTKPGGDAVALLELDHEVSEDVLQTIREVPHVLEATQLSFPSIDASV
ncbi:MAG: phosphoglycerate dehydrogenase [Rhodospirillaceae bacterium]|nr:phosphoglycerate dehydrogenase [Rhodospirillaceae bacterium]|tara:strand:+ start:14824 stop:16422 length:1599 start_codon:yes stop_codon:yes gene_type:complete